MSQSLVIQSCRERKLSPLTALVSFCCVLSLRFDRLPLLSEQLMWEEVHEIINLPCFVMLFSQTPALSPLQANCGWCRSNVPLLFFEFIMQQNPPSLVNGTQQVVASNSAGAAQTYHPSFQHGGPEALSSCSRHLTTATFIY